MLFRSVVDTAWADTAASFAERLAALPAPDLHTAHDALRVLADCLTTASYRS